MAKHVLKDAVVTINDTDISSHVSSVTIEVTWPEVDVTGMGANNVEVVRGIGDATITLEVFQDFDSGALDTVLWPLSQTETPFEVRVKHSSAPTSMTNPLFRMMGRLFSYSPIAGSVGDADTTTVTIRNASQTGLTRHTTDPT